MRVTRSGSQLTLTPMSEGEAFITVTATDPAGLSATQRFRATVAAASCSVEHLGTLRDGVPLTRNGSLGPDCVSPNFGGALARYYSFTLPDSANVQIDLASSAFDAYLILRAGQEVSGRVVAQNDDVLQGPPPAGIYDARIATGLPAGTYTIEATSFPSNQPATGAFTLTVSRTTGLCSSVEHLGSLGSTLPVIRNASLGPDCVSPNREGALARYYSFTLPEPSRVQIDMASSTFDTFLILREGQNVSGRFVAEDDDKGDGTNARITTDLPAGNYTIEATSFLGHIPVPGAFTLTVRNTRPGQRFDILESRCGYSGNERVTLTLTGRVRALFDYSSVRVRGIVTEMGGAERVYYLPWDDLGSMRTGETKSYRSSGTATLSSGVTGLACGLYFQYTVQETTANRTVTESRTVETSVVSLRRQ